MQFPTGEQFELSLRTSEGDASAHITAVAAGIRSFTLDGVDLVEPFDESQTPPMACGIVLAPWPNRVRDGVWEHDGKRHQLAITEPAKNNATHGLLRFTPYTLVDRSEEMVTIAATIYPQSGYPFLIETVVQYRLVDDGLEVTHSLQNVGADAAPVAVGAHPYFRIGDVPTEQLSISLAVESHFDTDDRLNPVAEVPVQDTEFDLRQPSLLGERSFDDGFGQGIVNDDGEVAHRLEAPDGRALTIWGDSAFDCVQLFTPPAFPRAGGPARAVAIEPMTAPADAFNSGKGVHWLAPGEEWTVRWGVRYSGFEPRLGAHRG